MLVLVVTTRERIGVVPVSCNTPVGMTIPLLIFGANPVRATAPAGIVRELFAEILGMRPASVICPCGIDNVKSVMSASV